MPPTHTAGTFSFDLSPPCSSDGRTPDKKQKTIGNFKLVTSTTSKQEKQQQRPQPQQQPLSIKHVFLSFTTRETRRGCRAVSCLATSCRVIRRRCRRKLPSLAPGRPRNERTSVRCTHGAAAAGARRDPCPRLQHGAGRMGQPIQKQQIGPRQNCSPRLALNPSLSPRKHRKEKQLTVEKEKTELHDRRKREL